MSTNKSFDNYEKFINFLITNPETNKKEISRLFSYVESITINPYNGKQSICFDYRKIQTILDTYPFKSEIVLSNRNDKRNKIDPIMKALEVICEKLPNHFNTLVFPFFNAAVENSYDYFNDDLMTKQEKMARITQILKETFNNIDDPETDYNIDENTVSIIVQNIYDTLVYNKRKNDEENYKKEISEKQAEKKRQKMKEKEERKRQLEKQKQKLIEEQQRKLEEAQRQKQKEEKEKEQNKIVTALLDLYPTERDGLEFRYSEIVRTKGAYQCAKLNIAYLDYLNALRKVANDPFYQKVIDCKDRSKKIELLENFLNNNFNSIQLKDEERQVIEKFFQAIITHKKTRKWPNGINPTEREQLI